MWPAKNKKQAVPAWTLFVVLGARRVQWAVRQDAQFHGINACDLEMSLPESTPGGLGQAAGTNTALQAVRGALDALKGRLEKTWPPTAGCQVRVLVSEHWAPVTGMPWSERLRNRAEANAAARAHLMACGFNIAGDDLIRMDDAPDGMPRLVAAYPEALLAALKQFSEQLGAQLGSVLPLGAAAWRVLLKRHKLRALALVDQGMSLIVRGDGLPCPADVTLRLTPAGCETEVAALWRRLVLREPGLDLIQPVYMLQMDAAGIPKDEVSPPFERVEVEKLAADKLPAGLGVCVQCEAVHHALDVITNRRPAHLASWGVGILVLALTGALLAQLWQTKEELRQLEARIEAARMGSQSINRAEVLSKADSLRVPAVNAAIRELNLPFAELLRALTASKDVNVAILSIQTMTTAAEAGGERSKVQIVGEAKTTGDMTRYVAFAGKSPTLSAVYLLRHEVMETLPGQPVRFTMEAQWGP